MTARKDEFKDRRLTANGPVAKHKEYFLKYDTGLSKVDSIKGIVVEAGSASDAVKALEGKIPYFRLLYISRV